MTKKKKSTSYTLTDTARELLQRLADSEGVSMSTKLEQMIRKEASKLKEKV